MKTTDKRLRAAAVRAETAVLLLDDSSPHDVERLEVGARLLEDAVADLSGLLADFEAGKADAA